MNFLAHVFLSGADFDLAVGNLIADKIKGNNINHYPAAIQKGIVLHRAIDTFTDTHPNFKNCVSTLFPTYRHYSRVIVDMYFDHFLAVHWESYHPQSLKDFSSHFYQNLNHFTPRFPEPIQRFIQALVNYNWFEQYETIEGLGLILAQMDRRTRFDSNLVGSMVELIEKYDYFEQQFFNFIQPLIAFSKSKLSLL